MNININVNIAMVFIAPAAVIRKQHFVSNHCQMIRMRDISSGPHTHACVISVIMCQIKRCKDSRGRMLK